MAPLLGGSGSESEEDDEGSFELDHLFGGKDSDVLAELGAGDGGEFADPDSARGSDPGDAVQPTFLVDSEVRVP